MSIQDISAVSNNRVYSEFNIPKYTSFQSAGKSVVDIAEAALANFINMLVDVPGPNPITRASGSIEGGLNYNPTTSFKERELLAATGEFAEHTWGFVA